MPPECHEEPAFSMRLKNSCIVKTRWKIKQFGSIQDQVDIAICLIELV